MRKTFLLTILLLVTSLACRAGMIARVPIQWTASLAPNIVSNRIYVNHDLIGSTNYRQVGNVTNANVFLPAGVTNYIAVTAIDTNGNESPPSNVIADYIPLPPSGLQVVQLSGMNEAIYFLTPAQESMSSNEIALSNLHFNGQNLPTTSAQTNAVSTNAPPTP